MNDSTAPTTLHDFGAEAIDGTRLDFAAWRGRPVLVVNTASECGFTPQLAGLEALWQRHRDAGLMVVGFPCNQFGGQEPGSNDEVAAFCSTRYAVSFPLMAKVEVNGDGAHPLWRWLQQAAPGLLGTERIKWNFTKFLVDADGRVIKRYAPRTPPAEIEADIQAALAAAGAAR